MNHPQVHNLVRPSPEIVRSERRLDMLKNLRVLLRTAQNCTLVGFTGATSANISANISAMARENSSSDSRARAVLRISADSFVNLGGFFC